MPVFNMAEPIALYKTDMSVLSQKDKQDVIDNKCISKQIIRGRSEYCEIKK